MTKIQVELTKIKDRKTGAPRPYKYSDIPKEDGWATAESYLPIPFDLMKLRLETREKDFPGWWDGQRWIVPRLRQQPKILKWKRDFEYD